MKSKLISSVLGLMFSSTLMAEIKMPESLETFFDNYCYSCHDEFSEKGDFNLEDLTRTIKHEAEAEHWQNVVDILNVGEMPPKISKSKKKIKQPSKAELATAIETMTEVLFKAQDKFRDSGGKAALRKLNRREYEGSIKSLTGLRFVGEKLPTDPSGRFDTIGKNQSLSALELSSYFAVAQNIAKTALEWSTKPRTKSTVKKEAYLSDKDTTLKKKRSYELLKAYERMQKEGITSAQASKDAGVSKKALDELGGKKGKTKYRRHKQFADYYERNKQFYEKATVLHGTRELESGRMSRFTYDPRAHHRITVSAGLIDPNTKIRRLLGVFPSFGATRQEGNLGNALDSFIVTGSYEHPSKHSFVLNSYYKSGKPKNETICFAEDVKTGNLTKQRHLEFIDPAAPANTIMVHGVEIEGPLYDPKSPLELLVEKYELGKSKDAQFDAKADKFLHEFATVAFRYRGVPDGFVEKLTGYYQERRKEGSDAKKALVDPLALILSSTRFLYLSEPENDQNNKLDPLSVANRLAFTLWSQPADAELYALAKNGKILQKDILDQQVDRMLKDPKAEAFFKGFMAQWMHLKRYDAVSLSEQFNVMRTDGMIHAAKKEPIEFFKVLVHENLSSSNLIDSDFVTINGQLAIKYGLSDHYSGNKFKKVKLPANSSRGGLLTQSAFLTAGTMGNRPSPIIRGSLVKEVLLNDPPPPPPPNVPELVHEGVDPLSSVTALVRLHQKDPRCASCHARFDFIGLGLENFDAVGLWRDKELVSNEIDIIKALAKNKEKSKEYDIDASGTLPNGITFNNVQELKKALMKQDRQVAWSVFEGLMCYTLGRDSSFTDRRFIEQSLDQLAKPANGERYAVKDMLKQVVKSKMFLEN